MRILLLSACLLLAVPLDAPADEGRVYYLLTYTPGSQWQSGVSYEQQPGLVEHFGYLQEQHEEDRLVLGGPVRDENRVLIVLQGVSLEEVRGIADRDPGVVAGVLEAEVTVWDVDMSSLRLVRKKIPPVIRDPNETWRLRRVDPESPIRIESSTAN